MYNDHSLFLVRWKNCKKKQAVLILRYISNITANNNAVVVIDNVHKMYPSWMGEWLYSLKHTMISIPEN